MFRNLLDRIDIEKLIEVVDLVWDNRAKIRNLVENLPQMLRETGDNIETAGASAVKASQFLVGGDGDTPGASKLSELAAAALDRSYEELNNVAQVMEKIGDEIDDVRIPSIKPKRREVMGISVVSGLDMGENKMVDRAADRIKDSADRLASISNDLKDVAHHLRGLGSVLNETGGDLGKVGSQLQESGVRLRSFSEMTDLLE